MTTYFLLRPFTFTNYWLCLDWYQLISKWTTFYFVLLSAKSHQSTPARIYLHFKTLLAVTFPHLHKVGLKQQKRPASLCECEWDWTTHYISLLATWVCKCFYKGKWNVFILQIKHGTATFSTYIAFNHSEYYRIIDRLPSIPKIYTPQITNNWFMAHHKIGKQVIVWWLNDIDISNADSQQRLNGTVPNFPSSSIKTA